MNERVSTVIVGAGPAGLAVSACLRKWGVDHVVLESEDSVASRWRHHYDRLHLHTFRDFSDLPFKEFARGVEKFPSRQQVVDYMEAYADEFGIAPQFGQEVKKATRVGDHWRVETEDRTYEASSLVIATGYNRKPHRPTWPGQGSFRGELFHACDYRNGARWKGKRALVIGAGNTGAEIAIDLVEHGAKTSLCIRSPIHVVPREFSGMPIQVTGMMLDKLPLPIADRLGRLTSRLSYGDLSAWGITPPKMGPISQIKKLGRVPLIDIGTIDLIRSGEIEVVPGVERFTEDGCEFVNGDVKPYDVVVLATGYRAAIDDFLEDAERYLDERGYPKVHGADAKHPGPYFVGYGNPPTGQLHEIKQHAQAVASKIARETPGSARV